MHEEGNSVYLNKKLFEEVLELERESLCFDYDVSHFYEEFLQTLLKSNNVFSVPYTEEAEKWGRERHYLIPATDEEYRIGNSIRLYTLLQPDAEEHILKNLKSDRYLTMSDDKNPSVYGITITPNSYSDKVELSKKLVQTATGCETYQSTIQRRKRLIERNDAARKKLERRAKEPFPFWETFGGAFVDIFKR